MTEQEIHKICEKYKITDYTINSDGSIDVNGLVKLSYDQAMTEFPLKFNRVNGIFSCDITGLTSLIGSPREVGGDFSVSSGGKLTSLVGCPDVVGGSFNCFGNKITSLEGSPKSVGMDFYCGENKIKDLEGFDTRFGGNFICHGSPLGSIFGEADYSFIQAFKIYKVLKDGVINLKRLKYVMSMFEQPIYIKSIKNHYLIE